MNSRERVTRAIELTGPDRVPIMHSTLPGAKTRHGESLDALYRRYPGDVVNVGDSSYGEFGPEINVPSRDAWGCLWVRHTDDHKGQVTSYLLADPEALNHFDPPNTATDEILDIVTQRIAANAGERYTLADGDTLWQRMYYLRGFQAANEDLVLRPQYAARLRDMILDVILHRLRRLAELDGLDGIHFRDDWGTQKAMQISPRLWRDLFKPAYAAMFEIVRSGGKHVWFHTDGMTEPIIPDLIELGAQVLNPQCNCMSPETLRSLIVGRACLLGDLDRQQTLPCGTPEEVRAAVRYDLDTYGRKAGGLIARGQLAADVPLENAEAMLEEMERYGTKTHS